jgi:hypothetical protein
VEKPLNHLQGGRERGLLRARIESARKTFSGKARVGGG